MGGLIQTPHYTDLSKGIGTLGFIDTNPPFKLLGLKGSWGAVELPSTQLPDRYSYPNTKLSDDDLVVDRVVKIECERTKLGHDCV